MNKNGEIIYPENMTVREVVKTIGISNAANFNICLNALPDGNNLVDMGTYPTGEMCAVPVMLGFFGDCLVDWYSNGDDEESERSYYICLLAGDFTPAMPQKAV